MGQPEAFLVLNADIMGDYPLLEFVEFHRKHPGEHSILATEVRTVAILLLNSSAIDELGMVPVRVGGDTRARNEPRKEP